ncbi:hypothetical protein C0580_03410 [Candidatus Parcubacteria bacterium]|nr:MAG: hypothetical protein C0580_03410 [Candidatus Parcubacteria bacterium]
MRNYKQQSGFSLIELLVAISFFSVMIVLIVTVTSFNSKSKNLYEERSQALLYAIEGMEAVKIMNWDNLESGDYSVVISTSTWELQGGSQVLAGQYVRNINIEDVYRENSSNGHTYGPITDTGGYLDLDTKKVSVTIDWQSRTSSDQQEILENYIYRFGAERTSQTDWVGGPGQSNWSDETKFFSTDSGMDYSIPGIVTLNAGFIDWNNSTTTATFDTLGNFDDNHVYETDGVAYLVTENNPSGPELYIIDVSDIYNPYQLGSLNIGDAVTSIVVQDDYAYISTWDNGGEVKVVDVSNTSSPFISGTYDLPTNDNALDIAVSSNQIYTIQGSKLYSFSINNPGDPSYLDEISVDDNATDIYLSGNYVYVATQDASKELQIIEVTNPANLSPIGQYDLAGSLKGTDIFVRGTRAFISTQNNGSGAEFFIFDIADPSNPSLLGSYEVNETVHSFSIVGPYALVGTNFLAQELIVLDVSVPSGINLVSGFDLNGYVLGMSANCSVIYAATSSNDGEFFILFTNVFDCDYSDVGILESSTFDTGSDEVVYNWIAWEGTEPSDTSIRLQLATSNNISGPWVFRGPDGTSNTYYTDSSSEFINYTSHEDQRYFRYKLYLDSFSGWHVPILEEITISYTVYP